MTTEYCQDDPFPGDDAGSNGKWTEWWVTYEYHASEGQVYFRQRRHLFKYDFKQHVKSLRKNKRVKKIGTFKRKGTMAYTDFKKVKVK